MKHCSSTKKTMNQGILNIFVGTSDRQVIIIYGNLSYWSQTLFGYLLSLRISGSSESVNRFQKYLYMNVMLHTELAIKGDWWG